jgi:predicted  nucleic acid-binding Zn-ribbon protein
MGKSKMDAQTPQTSQPGEAAIKAAVADFLKRNDELAALRQRISAMELKIAKVNRRTAKIERTIKTGE